jgi:hypothetical protein
MSWDDRFQADKEDDFDPTWICVECGIYFNPDRHGDPIEHAGKPYCDNCAEELGEQWAEQEREEEGEG